MGLRMENYGGSLKNSILWEFHEKSIYRGIASKGGLEEFANLRGWGGRGNWLKREGWCFWGGSWYPDANYDFVFSLVNVYSKTTIMAIMH